MLRQGNSRCEGAEHCAGDGMKSSEHYVCDIVLSPRGIDIGTIGAHVIKQYLFMRGLLPAPFDELVKLGEQVRVMSPRSGGCSIHLGYHAQRCSRTSWFQETESAAPYTAGPSKSRRTTNSAAKRNQKLINSLSANFSSLHGLHLQQHPITVLALFGPSSARPREALEIVFNPVAYQEESVVECQHGQRCSLSPEAVRKACRKATRKLVPLLSSLPLPKSSGSTKLFLAVAGHGSNDDFRQVHDRFISLKQCTCWTVLHVASTLKPPDLLRAQSYLERTLQRQMRNNSAPPDSSEDADACPCLAFCNATVPSLSFTSDVYAL